MAFDVFGIENPLIDLLVQVPDEFLEQIQVDKNAMYLIDEDRLGAVLKALEGKAIIPEPGGSCANTLIGIAQLGGKTAYCGMVGSDEYGRVYIDKLESAGVTSYIAINGNLTGSTIILVTPDAARTMNTFLGACQDLDADNIPLDALRSAKMLYITGYLWDTPGQQKAAGLALSTASKAGLTVAMSLSDAFCVERHHDDFTRILKEHVDLVFANRDEALAITGTDNTQEAMRVLLEWCPGVAITLGGNGALVCEDGELAYLDPFPVNAVDTTGAGDSFAAGYLSGKINGDSLLQRGRLGSYFAAQVIQHMGPRLTGNPSEILRPIIENPRA